jgi:hypothetical protein
VVAKRGVRGHSTTLAQWTRAYVSAQARAGEDSDATRCDDPIAALPPPRPNSNLGSKRKWSIEAQEDTKRKRQSGHFYPAVLPARPSSRRLRRPRSAAPPTDFWRSATKIDGTISLQVLVHYYHCTAQLSITVAKVFILTSEIFQ